MNEAQAINAILRERWLRNFCVPNYTPSGWWECDVFELTRAGYFVEYEIKLTFADYKADREKFKPGKWKTTKDETGRPHWQEDQATRVKKHSKFGDPSGPARFFYVATREVASRIINEDGGLPKWAGLIALLQPGRRIVEELVRPAPQLHGAKLHEKITEHARGVCYYRMHRLLLKRNKEKPDATSDES